MGHRVCSKEKCKEDLSAINVRYIRMCSTELMLTPDCFATGKFNSMANSKASPIEMKEIIAL